MLGWSRLTPIRPGLHAEQPRRLPLACRRSHWAAELWRAATARVARSGRVARL